MVEPPPLHVKPHENLTGDKQKADLAWAMWGLSAAMVVAFFEALLTILALRSYKAEHEILNCSSDAAALALIAAAVICMGLAGVALYMRMRRRLRLRVPPYLQVPSARGNAISLALGGMVMIAMLAFQVVLIASELYTH